MSIISKSNQARFRICSAGAFAALALLTSVTAHAETIAFTGFEESGDTWLGVVLSGTGGSFSPLTGSGDTPASQRILDGLRSFQITVGTATVDFDAIDVSAFDSIQLTIRISSTAGTSGNGNDGPDNVKLFVALNAAPFSSTPDITLSGNGNAKWGFDATKTGTTSAGSAISFTATSGTVIPNAGNPNNYSTLVITIPNSASSVDFRIVAFNDTANEFWNIDNVTLTGTIPEPSSMVALVGGLGMLCGFRRLRSPSRHGARV